MPVSDDPRLIRFCLAFREQPAGFVLRAYHGDSAVTLRAATELLPFRLILPVPMLTNATEVKIRPSDLEKVRFWMAKCAAEAGNREALFETEGFVKRINITQAPEWFSLAFKKDGGALVCELQKGVTDISDGWFLCGEQMWKSGLRENEAEYLRQSITGGALVRFVKETLPDWQTRGIPYECPLEYCEEPCAYILIENAGESSVSLNFERESKDIEPIPGADGYAINRGRVCPYPPEEFLTRFFPSGDHSVLAGDDIPDLAAAAKGKQAPFIRGGLRELLSLHDVFDKAELKLKAYTEEKNGIGQAYAIPVLEAGGRDEDPAKISRAVNSSAYVRIEGGYIPVSLLQKLGVGKMGRTTDGTPLDKPLMLKAEELFTRGSDRLKGPWTRMELPDLKRSAQEHKALCHLRFLAKWGINGGLEGGTERNMPDTAEFLNELQTNAPGCRILIVGKAALLGELRSVFMPLRPAWATGDREMPRNFSGILIIASGDLEKSDSVAAEPFDVLLMLEPDNMAKTEIGKTYRNLLRVRARLRLALYSKDAYKMSSKHEEVQRALLKLSGKSLAVYAVIDPDRAVMNLPSPYKFPPYRPFGNQDNFASVEVPGVSAPKGVSIPKRPEGYTGGIETRRPGYESPEPRFIRMAEELSQKEVKSAHFVPFMTYWPTYDRMTPEQTEWYLFWRGEVRAERYPETDLSYIFLYIYELLNLIGCGTKRQGYDLLMSVWKAYRRRYPRLDDYLANWMVDFIFLYELDVSLQEIITLCGNNISGDLLDIELHRRLTSEPIDITLPLLAYVSHYDIQKSRFYGENASEIEQYLPKVIALTDAYLKKKHGQRIAEMFDPGRIFRVRQVFRSAIYMGKTRDIRVRIVPFSSHGPLKDFMAEAVRCFENKLREIKGYQGRLRGVGLEPELQKLIELYLERETTEKPEPLKVTIDAEKLARLAKESEETREMLTAPDSLPDEEERGLPEYEDETEAYTPARSEPDGLPEFVKMLSREELRLLLIYKESGWEITDGTLPLGPALFEELAENSLNEKALDMLGRLLIVREGDKKLVDEDFREELEFLPEPASEDREDTGLDASGLTEGWKAFFEKLTPLKTELLRAVLAGEPDEALGKIADRAGSMTEVMIDEINEAAMETVGDAVIWDGKPEEEYEDILRKVFD